MLLETTKEKLKQVGLCLVEVNSYVIRPIDCSELHAPFIDEVISFEDLIDERTLELAINRVINRMEILLDEEEYKKTINERKET